MAIPTEPGDSNFAGSRKEISMSRTKTPAETQARVIAGQGDHRHRSAKPLHHRDLRGFWRTALALMAPVPGIIMALKIATSPFGRRDDLAAV